MGISTTAVFDTNIIIDALKGVDAAHITYTPYETVYISLITWIEVMVGANNEQDTREFLEKAFIILPITSKIAECAIKIKKEKRIKLPDAIIWATAITQDTI